VKKPLLLVVGVAAILGVSLLAPAQNTTGSQPAPTPSGGSMTSPAGNEGASSTPVPSTHKKSSKKSHHKKSTHPTKTPSAQ